MTGMMNIPVPYAAYASDLHLLRQGQDPVAELSKVLLVQPLVLKAADGLGAIYGDLFNMDHPQRPIQRLFFLSPAVKSSSP